jgi:DNA-binding NarL/FixJ family response regulator
VQETIAAQGGTGGPSDRPVQVLVISQHDVVRHQLVAYLTRSPGLAVRGDAFSRDAIERAQPDVLVLDLSQLGPDRLRDLLARVRQSGTRLIALASLRVDADERAVSQAGGIYRLKSAGADGLAEMVLATAAERQYSAV